MRQRHHKKTHRGLGDEDQKDDAPPSSAVESLPVPPPPPSSQRGVNAIAPEHMQPGRYSVRPGRRDTREFASPEASAVSSDGRRKTIRMSSVVDEQERASRDASPASGIKPRRLATASALELTTQLDSREAFVLSLLDGDLTVQAILDITALDASELTTILDRLVSLKLAALA